MSKVAYPRLHKALKAAVKAHKKQDRDGTDALPYVTHPVEVLSLVRYEANISDENVLCAAVLHDLIEETDWNAKDIKDDFGTDVTNLVRELTREEPASEGLSEEQTWQRRTAVMLREIDGMSNDALVIKLADRCSNLRAAMVTKTGDDLHRYARQSRLILDHIDPSVCPSLWAKIDQMLTGIKLPKKFEKLQPETQEPLAVG